MLASCINYHVLDSWLHFTCVSLYAYRVTPSIDFTFSINAFRRFAILDYDAPVAETGDLTDKYYALRKIIRQYAPKGSGQFESYVLSGSVRVKEIITAMQDLESFGKREVFSK